MEPAVDTPTTPPIEKHRPWKTLENTVHAIIDHTFDTVLSIVDGMLQSDRSSPVVDLGRPIYPADPDSPVLTVHAEATNCCFAFNNSRRDAAAYARYTAKSGKSAPTHRLGRTTISISPGTLHLARASKRGVVGRSAADYSGVSPDVGSSSVRPLEDVLAILDAVVLRLDAAIGMEEAMLGEANALSWCGSRPRVAAEIEEVLKVLREMRSEMDIDAIMRRWFQKRRRCVVQEIGTSRLADAADRDRADKTAEELAKRFKRMEVGSSSR